MQKLTADDLAQITGGTWHGLNNTFQFAGLCFDTRQINAGDCFVALSGGARDGHDFIDQAYLNGAAVAIVEQVVEVSIPQLQVADTLLALGLLGATIRKVFTRPVVGVTGSCGKTSTKEMLRLLLGGDSVHATAGNWNNRIGVPMTLCELDSDLHAYSVIEAGINQPEEMRFLGEMIRADLTLITNVGPAHLELLQTIENIAIEKAKLALSAKEGSPVVIPSDLLKYPVFAEMSDRLIVLHPEDGVEPVASSAEILTYKLNAVGAKHRVTLLSADSQTEYWVNTPSRGIAANAVLAIVAAQRLGVSVADTQERIARWQPAANRGRVIETGKQTFYADCYNANPASMLDALQAFLASSDNSSARAYILGGMDELGETAIALHQSIGAKLILRNEDIAIFVGPVSLTDAYLNGAISSGNSTHQLKCVQSVETMKSDIAQFKGALFLKGSRSYQLEKLLPDSNSTL